MTEDKKQPKVPATRKSTGREVERLKRSLPKLSKEQALEKANAEAEAEANELISKMLKDTDDPEAVLEALGKLYKTPDKKGKAFGSGKLNIGGKRFRLPEGFKAVYEGVKKELDALRRDWAIEKQSKPSWKAKIQAQAIINAWVNRRFANAKFGTKVEEMEARFETGQSPTGIAAVMGLSQAHVYQELTRLGLWVPRARS